MLATRIGVLMTKEKKTFIFVGAVVCDGAAVERGYKAETWAVSAKKAVANLTHRYRTEHDISKAKKLELVGDLKEA